MVGRQQRSLFGVLYNTPWELCAPFVGQTAGTIHPSVPLHAMIESLPARNLQVKITGRVEGETKVCVCVTDEERA